MKKNLSLMTLCLSLVVMVSASVHSQPVVEVGIKTGLSLGTMSTDNTGFVSTIRGNWDDIDFDDSFSSSAKTGLQAGGFVAINLGKYFTFQPELILTKKGVNVEGSAIYEVTDPGFESVTGYEVDEKISLTYLEIPILAKFRIPTSGGASPSLYVGPAFAFNLSGTDDAYLGVWQESEFFDYEEKYQTPDKNMGYGLINMLERIKSLNGEFHIETQVGKGTKIYFHVPLAGENV